MASDAVQEFTDDNFDAEVLQSGQPVLVDFWAEWCMPCRMIAAHVDSLASQYDGKLKVGKVDIDSNQETAVKYGIQSIPSLLVFKDGQVVGKLVGARNTADALAEELNLAEVTV